MSDQHCSRHNHVFQTKTLSKNISSYDIRPNTAKKTFNKRYAFKIKRIEEQKRTFPAPVPEYLSDINDLSNAQAVIKEQDATDTRARVKNKRMLINGYPKVNLWMQNTDIYNLKKSNIEQNVKTRLRNVRSTQDLIIKKQDSLIKLNDLLTYNKIADRIRPLDET